MGKFKVSNMEFNGQENPDLIAAVIVGIIGFLAIILIFSL